MYSSLICYLYNWTNLFVRYFFVGGVKYEKLIELVDNPNSFGNQRPMLPIEVNYILFLQSSRSISNIAFEGTSITEIQLVVW